MITYNQQQGHTQLKSAHLEYLRKSSTMPDAELIGIAKNKKRNLKTTNGITAAICDYVKYVGGASNRINTIGRKIKNKQGKEIFIKSSTKRGTFDIDVVYNGLAIKIEVKNKNTKDKISDKQIEMKAKLEAAGALTFIADSFESFLMWWANEIESKTPARA